MVPQRSAPVSVCVCMSVCLYVCLCVCVCVYVCLGDSVEFLSWFLNALHLCLGGSKKSKETVISRTFRGNMRIYSRKVPPIDMVHSLNLLT